MNWPALMAVGLGALRLPPAVFWSMTPRELDAALGPRRPPAPPARADFDALCAHWPDEEPPHG